MGEGGVDMQAMMASLVVFLIHHRSSISFRTDRGKGGFARKPAKSGTKDHQLALPTRDFMSTIAVFRLV